MDLHKLRVLVIGYYNHFNLGDEQYKWTILYLLKRVFYKKIHLPEITFIDCDMLKTYQVQPNTMVILGGGDVLNHYFLDSICNKFMNSPPVSIIALSVGIPYDDIFMDPEQRKKLQILDHIFLRTQQDLNKLNKYVTKPAVHYLPDTSCFAMDCLQNVQNYIFTQSFRIQYQKIQSISKNYQRAKLLRTDPDVMVEGFYTSDKPRKIIGIMWCRHIYHPESPYRENYLEIVKSFASLMDDLIQKQYSIVMIPFNTKSTKKGEKHDVNKENDVLIQRDVMKFVQPSSHAYICNIEETLSLEQTMYLYKQFYLAIPMRFHATLFSVYSGVPMIPIYTTKKIRNFLLDIQWPYDNVLEKNNKDLPTRFDKNAWWNTFTQLTDPVNYLNMKRQLLHVSNYFKQKSIEQTSLIRQCMDVVSVAEWRITTHIQKDDVGVQRNMETIVKEPTTFLTFSQKNPLNSPLPDKTIESLIAQERNVPLPLITQKKEVLHLPLSYKQNILYPKLQKFAKENGKEDFRLLDEFCLQQIAVYMVSYFLTNSLDSPYNHGLQEKMFSMDYHYGNEWSWIEKHWLKTNSNTIFVPPQKITTQKYSMRFNLGYIDQNDKSGVHRSGWKYVFDHLQAYNDTSESSILLDLYVDRTFHWKRTIFRNIDIIPYKKPWIGFIHHTFNTEFSEYNNHNLIKTPEFLQSLPFCRALIVLSETLQLQFMNYFQTYMENLEESVLTENDLNLIKMNPIPIFVLQHPTEFDVPMFDYMTYLSNRDKKIIHIGGWMRNIFSFYQLDLHIYPFSTTKRPVDMVTDQCANITTAEPSKCDQPQKKPWYSCFCSCPIFCKSNTHTDISLCVLQIPKKKKNTSDISIDNFGQIEGDHRTVKFENPAINEVRKVEALDHSVYKLAQSDNNVFSYDESLLDHNWTGGRSPQKTNLKHDKVSAHQEKNIENKHTFRKVILKGKQMNNYFPDVDWREQINRMSDATVLRTSTLGSNPISAKQTSPHHSPHISSTEVSEKYCSTEHKKINNNWFKHMMEYLNKINNDIEIMEYVENDVYDQLLTKNIVFLNLVDGSAINTLLECLVRNTPIVINRHPAVIEILGENYPLLYDDISTIGAMLRLPNIIFETHLYLKKIDKSPFHIDFFLKRLDKMIGQRASVPFTPQHSDLRSPDNFDPSFSEGAMAAIKKFGISEIKV